MRNGIINLESHPGSGQHLGWVRKMLRVVVVTYLQMIVFLAAGPGFEPGLSDSESLVLPLHHPAMQRRIL